MIRTKNHESGSTEGIRDPCDERSFRSDDNQVWTYLLRELAHGFRIARIRERHVLEILARATIPWGDEHFRNGTRGRQARREGMFPGARAKDQNTGGWVVTRHENLLLGGKKKAPKSLRFVSFLQNNTARARDN